MPRWLGLSRGLLHTTSVSAWLVHKQTWTRRMSALPSWLCVSLLLFPSISPCLSLPFLHSSASFPHRKYLASPPRCLSRISFSLSPQQARLSTPRRSSSVSKEIGGAVHTVLTGHFFSRQSQAPLASCSLAKALSALVNPADHLALRIQPFPASRLSLPERP